MVWKTGTRDADSAPNESQSSTAQRPVGRPDIAAHSRMVQRVRRRWTGVLDLLDAGLPGPETMRRCTEALMAQGHATGAALRIMRQLVMERLCVLDTEQAAPLEAITGAMTHLAEVALDIGYQQAATECDARWGPPIGPDGNRIAFWIVGMGKLGARELNVSSDIDLVYVYEDEGQTAPADGGVAISAHEYFAHLAKRLYTLIGDTTEDGFVFRMDLALRPNGNSGPPVVSLGMLEEYFLVQGREWERFAWLKSRVCAPLSALSDPRTLALRQLVVPFVYRRYLDYGVFESLRQLHLKIRTEAQRRAAGRPQRGHDVKLSRGGIREIEFIVQLMLVVRGGQFPELRTRQTLRALERLAAQGLMDARVARQLAEDYRFLREVEHRIQYLDDQQTHLLPAADADMGWLAETLGHGAEGSAALLERLMEARERVATEFDALLHDGRSPPPVVSGVCRSCGSGPLPVDSDALLAQLPDGVAERVRQWCTHPRVLALRDDAKLRLGRLLQRAEAAMADEICDEAAVLRFVDWLEPLLKRESYLALLVERPEVQRRLLRLLGMARWPMQYLMRHPAVIDELADNHLLHERFDASVYAADLDARRNAWRRAGQADEESLLDTLRRAHHAEVFRTLVRDVEQALSVEQVADDLSALADSTLEIALRWSWPMFRQGHRAEPQLAVIAYGKLGGKELGYGSDLDVVFLYDDSDESDSDRAQEIYGAYLRKLITWLTLRTAAGELFDIDTALRPNGNSGLLVTSMAAFERYQSGRGSNTAWTWEHQAITRARFCAGSRHLGERFQAVRQSVICAERDPQALRDEVRQMRERVRSANPSKAGRFDLKHGPGGMMDAEFVVQFLVLAHGRAHAPLLDNAGNIALLQRAEACGLLQAGTGMAAADAYRTLRRLQHRARLDEQPAHVDDTECSGERNAILSVWHQVMG
ncbi:MAG: bifunctional [glutamate--ammonia ligase]-adenylyl-L-tyrosine phosphorylase/[glutamate--ammonia-ligase] adenylyltransferase [Rubrivivax sp.]|jgi:glutamate-ammonia-ligase adenylyltransferase